MSTTAIKVDLPEGTWAVDATHSNANFEVEHAGVSVFRGGFKPVDAKLTVSDAGLAVEGTVDVESISVDDENIRPHLLSPEFFDVERNPGITYRSTEITGDADDLTVTGELSMAGFSLPVAARGRLRGPIAGTRGRRQDLARARGHHRPHGLRHELADGAAGRRRRAGERRQAHRRARAEPGLEPDAHPRRLGQPPRWLPEHAPAPRDRGAGAGGGRVRDLQRPALDPPVRRGRRHRPGPPAGPRPARRRRATPTACCSRPPNTTPRSPAC